MKRFSLAYLLLVLIAFGVRVASLGDQSVWWDEAFTWQSASRDLTHLWQTQLSGDRNPPLYPLLALAWGSLAGWGEFALRFLPLMLTLLGLVFTANLTRRLFDARAGAWTLALTALAPPLIVYAQEARTYALFFAAAAATLYFALKMRDFDAIRERRQWLALLLAEAVLLLSHYFALPIVAVINVLALTTLIKRPSPARSIGWWLSGQFAAALPLIGWLAIVFTTPGTLARPAEAPPDVIGFARQALIFWLSGVRDLTQSQTALTWIVVGWFGLSMVGARLVNRRRAAPVLIVGGLAAALAFALTLFVTAFHPRYLLPYALPLWVLAGAAISALHRPPRRWLGGAALIASAGALLAGWAVMLDPVYAKDDARGVAAYLKTNARAEDVILVEANDFTLDYYDHGPAAAAMITATNDADAFEQLSAATAGRARVWHVHWRTSTQDPRGYWPFLLEQSGELQDWTSYRGYDVYRYELHQPLYQPVLTARSLSFGSYAVTGRTVTSADSAITLAVEWVRVSGVEPVWTRASIRLSDEGGHLVSSVDGDLFEGVNYYRLPLPPGTPPTKHPITIRLYDQDQTSAEQIDSIQIVPHRSGAADPYRTLSGYAWREINLDVAPGLRLEAAAVGNLSPAPLEPVNVALRWRKTGSPSDARPRLRVAQADRVWAETGSALFESEYPLGNWVDQEMVIDRLDLIYPPVRGETQLQIGVDDHWINIGAWTLNEAGLLFEPPSMAHAQSAQFGEFAELLGYDLTATSIAVDRPLVLTLVWRAANTEPITTPYTVFTQLIAPDGHLVAQHDAPPKPPTTSWVPGQIVIDSHALKVVDSTYRGPATLIVGWYNSASVARVPVAAGGDFVTLGAPLTVEDR